MVAVVVEGWMQVMQMSLDRLVCYAQRRGTAF